MKRYRKPVVGRAALACWLACQVWDAAFAQTTLTPWGNVTAMRVGQEPVEFEAGLRIVHPDWEGFSGAVKYLQRPHYSRTGAKGVVESAIEGLSFRESLEDVGPGKASLQIEVTAKTNLAMAGVYFCVDLPDAEFAGGDLELIGDRAADLAQLPLAPTQTSSVKPYLRQAARGLKITAPRRRLELRWEKPIPVIVRRDASDHPTPLNDPSVRQRFVTNPAVRQPAGYQVYLELMAGDAAPERKAAIRLSLAATGTMDPRAVNLVLDVTKPGRPFDGIGGNFCLQFSKTEAEVVKYCLENLRVAWGRVNLRWAEWDSEEQSDPLATARAGKFDPKLNDGMEMARVLARRRIPVIVSVWSVPKWARAPDQPSGLRGTALNLEKLDRICSSIASYLVFLKEHVGVEAVYFSFNEPETGVEVRQTAAEHLRYIKALGAELARRGLTTHLLLGDTAHGTPGALDFIRPALADLAAHRYIGAVAFHAWRGCTADSLPGWAEAARQLGVPLLVTEAGPDAHLHEYPKVRLEPWFQLQEIELYLRICAFGQPATIMEWQFTSDYSLMTGEGIYGESGPVKTTQRFWNLKQLGTTPPGAFALPISADRQEVTCAAFGNPLDGTCAVHLVNRGAQRTALLFGFPQTLSVLRRLTTDANRGMEEGEPVRVSGGRTELTLPQASYTTLLGTNPVSPFPAAKDLSN